MTTLYRGDATSIPSFEIDKTDARALFGRGIYLTDNQEVAHDYTISKGAGNDLVHSGEQYPTQKDAIAGYLRSIISKELHWRDRQEEIRSQFSRDMYRDPEFTANSGYQGDKTIQRAIEKQWSDRCTQAMVEEYKKYLKNAKKIFHSQSQDLRVIRDTTGNWIITRAGRGGSLSIFEIPTSYLAATLHGDHPMDGKLFTIVRDFVLKYRPNGMDNRTRDNEIVTDFDKWIEHFKTTGSYYGWRDEEDPDYYIGGNGVNPTLGELWSGSFGGMTLFQQHGGDFIPMMMEHGYTGIEYDGGVRSGTVVRGLGGVRHQAYVLWDAEYVNKCRTTTHGVNDQEIDKAATRRFYATSMLGKHWRDDR